MKREPWALNRGHWELSTVAHMRALHRRRTISEALAAGIWHFRLDVPRERLKTLKPHGLIGLHLWKVRTLAEWQEIFAAVNATRRDASAFDSLGFHHGDYTYVTPIPLVHLEAATAHGKRLRDRWLNDRPRKKKGRRRTAAA